MASNNKQACEIKDKKLWLIPFGTLCTMIIAGCVAIVLLANFSMPGLFKQVDLGVVVSRESLNSFEQKVNLKVDPSISSYSTKTHTFVYEGENYLTQTPISSEEFSSFIAYIQPSDSPIKSPQIKFSRGLVEVSAKMSLSKFTELISGSEEGNDGDMNNGEIVIIPIFPEGSVSDSEILDPTSYGSSFNVIVGGDDAADWPLYEYDEQFPSDNYEDGYEDRYEDEYEYDESEEVPAGLRKLLSLLPDTVNIYAKGSGIIIDNEITSFEADVVNVSGFNLASFVGEEKATEFAEGMINSILSLMNEKLGMYFEYTSFTDNNMIFTGIMPEKIYMVEIGSEPDNGNNGEDYGENDNDNEDIFEEENNGLKYYN